MPFNGSGVFQRVRNWVADAAAGIKIRADRHDEEDDNFKNGLSECITRSGQTTISSNIPFNGKRITGLADPVNEQDAATKASSVNVTGDSMTGDLMLSTNAVTAQRFQIYPELTKFWIKTDGTSLVLHGGNGSGVYGINFQNGAGTVSWASIGPSGMRVAGTVTAPGRSGDVNLVEALEELRDRIEALESRGS